MDFSNIARQLGENVSIEAANSAEEKATAGGQKQIDNTNKAKEKQKAQMATQTGTPVKSDISYTSEEFRRGKERHKMMENSRSDWKSELIEAAGVDENGQHPYVDVMPFVNQKADEAKKQMKAAAKMASMEGGKQAKMAEQVLNEREIKAANTTWGRKLEKEAKKNDHKEDLEKGAAEFMQNSKNFKEGFKEDEIETMRQQHQAREEQKKKLPKYKAAPQSRQSPYGRQKNDPYRPRGGESD